MDKSNQYMKILIIGSSSLGDFIINSTGIIKKLNETYENLEIHLIKEKRSMDILDDFPNITYIYEYSKIKYSLHWLYIFKDFIFQEYDIIYDFKNSIGNILFSNQKYIYKSDKNSHILDSIKNQFSLNYFPKPYLYINNLKCDNFYFENINHDYVTICASNLDKDIQSNMYIDIINYLFNKNIKCILIGSDIELEFFNKNENILKNKVLNFINRNNKKVSVLESSYIIKKSKIFIGRDSGFYHISQSLDINSIIFFKLENLKRFKPINKNIKYFLVEENNNYNKIMNEINNFLN